MTNKLIEAYLEKIARQLEIANQLKFLEFKRDLEINSSLKYKTIKEIMKNIAFHLNLDLDSGKQKDEENE